MAHRGIVDGELLLRDSGQAALTATGNGALAVALNAIFTGKFANTSGDQITTKINVAAVDGTTADETYVLTLQTDSVSDFTDSPVTHQSVTIDRDTTGLYELMIDLETLLANDPDAAFIRLNHTLGGTTPSITYSAFLNPITGSGRP